MKKRLSLNFDEDPVKWTLLLVATLWVILSLCSSCRTIKSHKETDIKREWKKIQKRNPDFSYGCSIDSAVRSSVARLREWKYTVYDTSQSVDSVSGRLAVQADIVLTEQVETSTESPKKHTTHAQAGEKEKKTFQSIEEIRDKEVKEKRSSPTGWNLFIGFVLGVVGSSVTYCKWDRRK